MEIIVNSSLWFAFFILALITIYYSNRSKHFEERNLIQLFVSFLQGVIIVLIFPKYFQFASIFALVYYFISINTIKMLKLTSGKHEDYIDEELNHELKKISEIKNFKFSFKKYSSENSMNAYVFLPKKLIFLGDELISKLTIAEKMFVISHEIGHILEKDSIKNPIKCFVVVIILGLISIISYPVVIELNESYVYLLINLMIFISGIIGLNYIMWHSEYNADKKALQLTNDKKSLESAFTKLKERSYNKDYGMIINLIVYDHPLTKDRIIRSEKLNQ